MKIFTSVLFLISLILLVMVDWKVAVGVFIFGWAMNAEKLTGSRGING